MFTKPNVIFNVLTGKFRDREESEKKKPKDEKFDKFVWSYPNPKCKYCYGRGYYGYVASNMVKLPCKCVRKMPKKIIRDILNECKAKKEEADAKAKKEQK